MQTRSQSKFSLSISSAKPTVVLPKVACSPVTRSQSHRFSAPVFDFDEASAAWLLNKNKLGNGTYSYKKATGNTSNGITTRSGKVLSV
jgi:hypothetical protein